MANKKLTPLQILYKEFKNAKTDAARNEAWRKFEVKRGEMYPPRSDRKSAMLRDSAAVAAKYPTKVLGGENHRYYEPGRRIRMDVDETAKRSPEIFVDPESGERYVRAFHYTNPENIENILQNGLAARLGPDAKNFQRRAGVWTSFGNANPMPYDYVNRASLGEKGYAMEPLEIRIPEEEWKAMPMDHTGETVNDQVMVFRPSKAKPYGTVNIAGEKAPVVIPPEYISRYEFPKDYETKMYGGTKSLWGYTPTKKFVRTNDKEFAESLPSELFDEAVSALGNDASYNQINQWVVDNRQNEFKNYLMSKEYKRPYGGLNNDELELYSIPEGTNTHHQDIVKWRNMKNSANRQYFGGTYFKTPYDLAVATEKMPKSSDGFIGNALSDKAIFNSWEKPKRTTEFMTNAILDNVPIMQIATGSYNVESNPFMAKLTKNKIEVPKPSQRAESGDYLNMAGFRHFDYLPTVKNRNTTRKAFNGSAPRYSRDELRKFDIDWRNNFYREGGYKEKVDKLLDGHYNSREESREGTKEAGRILDQFQIDLRRPEVMKERRKAVMGMNESPYWNGDYEHNMTEPQKVAKARAWNKAVNAFEHGAYEDALDRTEKFYERHPELDRNDLDVNTKVYQPIKEKVHKELQEKFYPEELQNVRQQLVEDWKKQFTQDSLNRVYGHELGRKLGKYRASRGKPVNPKQL
jgi:hypothetical protein